MTGLALALILVAAVAHATWNLITKQAPEKLPFLWCAILVSCVIYLPLGLYLAAMQPASPLGLGVMVLSAGLEVAYFWLLSQAYRHGDLSLVYPVARGVAPLIVPVLGVALLGERLSAQAVLGVVCIAAGVLVVHLPSASLAGLRALAGSFRERGTRYALLTGLSVAAYSTLDKQGVALVHPLLYAYGLYVATAAGLALLLSRAQRGVARLVWSKRRGRVAAVGILMPGAYALVLIALSFSQVSYVVPAREVSIVFAAILGALVLREPYGRGRITGSALITLGLVLLALG